MVIQKPNPRPRKLRRIHSPEAGSLLTELMVALVVLVVVVLPFITTYAGIHKSVRISYQRAIAMELVDGEMEILLAGAWRDFPQGSQPYALRGNAVANLPPGKASLTVTGQKLRLEWVPDKKDTGGRILREAVAK